MDRRIRKVIRILPTLIFSPPGDSETADDDDRKRKRDRKLLEDVAKEVNLSPLHLCRLFRAEIGMTFKQYADKLIMEKAIEMANNGYLTINQIVDEIGAGDDRNFRRRLKKIYGLTLSQFGTICEEWGDDEGILEDGDKKQLAVKFARK